jgi:hypothetical protein
MNGKKIINPKAKSGFSNKNNIRDRWRVKKYEHDFGA